MQPQTEAQKRTHYLALTCTKKHTQGRLDVFVDQVENVHLADVALVKYLLEGYRGAVSTRNEQHLVCDGCLWKFMFATVSCTTDWLLFPPSCPR